MSAVRVGISGITRQVKGARRSGVNASYVQSVVNGGGVPLILSPIAGAAYASAMAMTIDALVLTGGEDLDPAWYSTTRSATVTTIDRDRDLFDLALYAAAKHLGIPVLAICRGMQLVNIAHGGTLVQDLPSQRPSSLDHNPDVARDARVHQITCNGDSALAALLGETTLAVNSFHHQAIDAVGDDLHVVATSSDGVIEGIEGTSGAPWLVGAQWHPEEMWGHPDAPDAKLFSGLVAAAAARSS